MAIERTSGIILKSIKYSDTDRILTCYTAEYGKIQCIAKRSSKKKNTIGSSIDLLTYSEMVIVKEESRSIYPLRETGLLRSYYCLHDDLPRLYAAFYMAELIRELTCFEDHKPEILTLLLQHLDLLQRGGDIEQLIHIFEIRLLTLLGYRPQLEKCLFCLAPPISPKLGFIPAMGGIICPDCFSKRKAPFFIISLGSLNFLRQAIKLRLDQTLRLRLTPSTKRELQNLLYDFIVYHLEKQIHSYRFLIACLKDFNII